MEAGDVHEARRREPQKDDEIKRKEEEEGEIIIIKSKNLYSISRKTSQQNQILSNKQENERKKKNERSPLLAVCFSYLVFGFFPRSDSTVCGRSRIYCIHAFMHIIQEQETCTLCTYDAPDRHVDSHNTHMLFTHTIAFKYILLKKDTATASAFMTNGWRAHKPNMRETKTWTSVKKWKTIENNEYAHKICFFFVLACRCKTLVAKTDEMWYIILLDKQKLKRKAKKQKRQKGDKRQQHLTEHVWCVHVSGVYFISEKRRLYNNSLFLRANLVAVDLIDSLNK